MESEKQTPPEETKMNIEQPPQPSLQAIRKLNVKTLSNHVFQLQISPNVNSLPLQFSFFI